MGRTFGAKSNQFSSDTSVRWIRTSLDCRIDCRE